MTFQSKRRFRFLLCLCMLLCPALAFSAPLNGVYTVGGTSPSYATVVDAVNALNTDGVSGPVTFFIRNGTYNGRFQINSVTGISATRRVTFVSETSNAANVIIQHSSTSAATNSVVVLNGASYISFRAVTIKNNGTTFGRAAEFKTTAAYDSIVNCVLEGPVVTTSNVNTAIVYATGITGTNNVLSGNTIKNGSYGIVYQGTSTTNLAKPAVFVNNTIQNAYEYGAYFYHTQNLQFLQNTITTTSTATTFNGIYGYYCDGAFQLVGNKITQFKGGYGMYLYYCDGTTTDLGLVSNNVIVAGDGTTSNAVGIHSYYSSYQRFYNNSVNVRNTSAGSYGGYFYCNAAAQKENELHNNVFSNSGGGRAIYIYNPIATYFKAVDYNNYYTTGAVLVQRGTPAATYNTLTLWRAAVTFDHNSISYAPGFTSNTNLAPNAADAASWSLNGRGIQLAAVNNDVNGNTRPVTLAAGVPDIGAYEFLPTVPPPAATATPAAPAAGGTQLFTFGGDTVAVIVWSATAPVPATITVRQYTNTAPAGIAAISSTNMYFYTDFVTPVGAYGHTTRLYYKDPWKGTTVNESLLRLAQKLGAAPWTGYTAATSTTDIGRNIISTTDLTSFGNYTGIDVSNNGSGVAVTEPKPFFCAGTFPVKMKIANKGNNVLNNVQIGWELDGVAQVPVNYTTPLAQNAEVVVTLGNVVFNNKPKNIKAFTYLPNNSVDIVPLDDTVKDRIGAGLSGEYTVGGTTPDYATVLDAVKDLHTFGVCGPVVFNIRDGNYTDQIVLNAIQGSSAVNRITFQSENHNPANVTIAFNAAGSANNYVVKLNSSSFITFKDLTMSSTNTTYGRVLELAGTSGSDSVVNCTLLGAVVSASDDLISIIYATSITGKDNVFINNRIMNGSYGVYYYGTSTTTLVQNASFIGNTIQNFYVYGMYMYNTKDLKIKNNIINTSTALATSYGIRSYYGDGRFEVSGNNIFGQKGGYGMYIYYSDGTATDRGVIANNKITIGQGTTTGVGIRHYYGSYQSIYNNSVNVLSSSTTGYAAYFYYSSTTYQNNEIYNNAFSNTGGGPAMYSYNPTYNNKCDYNNLYTTGGILVQRGTPAATFANLTLWRAANNLDVNSISHDPGFMSATNLQPDINNPASWSLNGRGIHLPGNDKDCNGSPRVISRADGVPDIGAHEFTPGVTPPAAKATPAISAAGTTQLFTFGEDTVAIISWTPNSIVPNNINVRQYTGTKPMQFPVPAHMYFYTHIDVQNVTHEFDATIYYKDPWLGSTGTESNLRLAQKLGASPWIAYNDAASKVNTTYNTFSANSMTSLGQFTGIENGSVFSALITPMGSTVFCPGGSVTLQANTGSGFSYQWQLNGQDIPNATNGAYTATMAGDYTVKMTNGNNVTVVSLPVAITIVSPPAAVINASGPLSYCPGGTLTLNANTGIALTYQWYLNANPVPFATTPSIAVTTAGSYSVIVTNIGCATTSPATIVVPGPLAVDLGLDTSFCELKPLTLDAGHPGATYTWSTGATTQQISVTNQSGKYWVFVDAGPNCQASDTIQVAIDPLPSVTGISYLKSGTNTYMFTASGALNVETYLWMFNDGSRDTAKSPSYSFNSNHPAVTLVVYNGCGTDTFNLVLPSSVKDAVNLQDSKIYPVPASDNVTIEIANGVKIDNIVIVNSVGQVVYKETANVNTKHTIDVKTFAPGYYIARVYTPDGIVSLPFNIQR